MKKVYIAGPYTKGDIGENIRRAILLADDISKMGFIPFVPHLTHLWHLVSSHLWDYWIAYDLEWLKSCDILFRMVGESKGADIEVDVAGQLSIPVVYTIEELQRIARLMEDKS